MFALYFDNLLQRARTSDEQRIIVLKPLLHYTASSENTEWQSISLILDAFYTVKAVLVSWTRSEHYHGNCKAWQNDY